jgi:hypothetical protein
VVRIFPNRTSCLRLVSALAVEQSEEWLTGRRYLDMREFEQPWHQERETKEVALEERMKMIDGHVGQCSVLFEEFARLFRERDDYAGTAGHNRARAALQRWMEAGTALTLIRQ